MLLLQERAQRSTTVNESVKGAKESKESKAAKAARLDNRHKFVLARVADLLGLEANVVEDHVLEGDQLDDFDSLFAQDGARHLLFYYQETGAGSKKSKDKKVFIATPKSDPLQDRCVYCVRANTKAVSNATVGDICFGLLNVSGGKGGILEGLQTLMSRVIEPSLRTQESWGKMSARDPQKNQFLDTLDKFRASLGEAFQAVSGSVTLTPFEPKEGSSFALAKLKVGVCVCVCVCVCV